MDAPRLHEIFERSQARALTTLTFRAMLQPMFDAARAEGRSLDAAHAKLETLIDALPLADAMADAVNEHLSDDDANALLEFFRSPLGERYARYGVDTAGSATTMLQSWVRANVAIPALRAAGVSREEAEAHGLDMTDDWRGAAWGDVDGETQRRARGLAIAVGFEQRIEELIAAQNAELTQQGMAAVTVGPDARAALVERVAESYARGFSPGDLTALLAFFQTPFGQRFIAMTPIFNAAGERAIERWTKEMPGALEQRVAEIVELLQ